MIARLEQWIRWPLWSWRHLVVTVVAVLVLFTALGRLTNSTPPPSRRTRSAIPASPSRSPASLRELKPPPSSVIVRSMNLGLLSSTTETLLAPLCLRTFDSASWTMRKRTIF